MLTKQYGIMAAVLFLTGLLTGCSSKDPDRYYNEKDDFSLMLQKDWETKEGFMGTSIISLSPQENSADEFRENVNVVVEQLPAATDLDGYFTASTTSLKKVITNFQENEKGTASINETDAKWLIYSGSMGTQTLKGKQYYMVHGDRGYVITCSATPDGFSRYKNAFDGIVQSFEFE